MLLPGMKVYLWARDDSVDGIPELLRASTWSQAWERREAVEGQGEPLFESMKDPVWVQGVLPE